MNLELYCPDDSPPLTVGFIDYKTDTCAYTVAMTT